MVKDSSNVGFTEGLSGVNSLGRYREIKTTVMGSRPVVVKGKTK